MSQNLNTSAPRYHHIYLLGIVFLCWGISPVQAEEFEYRPQKFFDSGDTDFYSIDDRQPLQRIFSGSESLYMTQDGDIYDEDVALLSPPVSQARSSDFSFRKSKYILATQVYQDHRIAFYSGCRFRKYQKKLVPVHSSCGYKPRKNVNRSKRIEWEHVVPAWVFGHQLKCWQEGGRAHCRNSHKRFRQMEADMHNLVPAIGEINGDRSNYRYQMIAGEKRAYGKPVNMEIDFGKRHAEPPENVFGDIGRIYLYMKERYGFRVSKSQLNLFRSWNNLDPVDDWERKRNRLLTQLQGNHNPFVTYYKKIPIESGSDSPGKTDSSISYGDDDNWVDQLYRLIYESRDQMPYFVVSIATMLYLVYLRYRRKTKPTTKKKKKK